MLAQIAAIFWAQFRILRNHLPRTTFGSILGGFLSFLWYGLFAAGAVAIALKLPAVPKPELLKNLPVGLLGVFLFWQIIPLFTLSTGWSLELNKLQVYPIRRSALFTLEVLLRLSSAPEMLLILLGTITGLLRYRGLGPFWPLAILLFIPLNLFLQLGIRDLTLHALGRNRFRELFAIVIISLAVLPQLLVRTEAGRRLFPQFLAAARSRYTPWLECARLALGLVSAFEMTALVVWIALAYLFARAMFTRGLQSEETMRVATDLDTAPASGTGWSSWPTRLAREPLANLMQKELQSLFRMPKFRVIYGMACFLGLIVFVPVFSDTAPTPGSAFMRHNILPVVNLYGLLVLSDTLLLNTFGLDRAAAQLYFVAPVPFTDVLKAKNLTAVFFVITQTAITSLALTVARAQITAVSFAAGILASAVVTVCLLSFGNYTSLALARPVDPKQTFKKQAGAKMQIYILGCSLILAILVGFAFLAQYAFNSNAALLLILACEFGLGLLFYRWSLESATTRAHRNSEDIVNTLSKSSSPVSFG